MLTFRSLEYTKGIEVLVGDTEIKFMVHKHVVTKVLGVLSRHDCKERNEQRIYLPECRGETFDCYLRRIYTGTMETSGHFDSDSPTGLHRLVELSILADCPQNIKLCNAITDELRSHERWYDLIPLPGTFTLAYHAFPDNAKLRDLLTDAFDHYDHGECDDDCDKSRQRKCVGPPREHPRMSAIKCNVGAWLDANKDSLPADFPLDLAKAGVQRQHIHRPSPLYLGPGSRPETSRSRCYYHAHNAAVRSCTEA